jgi:diacylglycerol kinase (ATP)
VNESEGRPIHRRAADSLAGLRQGFRRDLAMRTHIILSLAAIAGLAWLRPALTWTLSVVVLLVLGLAAELFNGALEAALDRLHPGEDAEIGAAKDMASAAAMVINCAAVVATGGAILSELL